MQLVGFGGYSDWTVDGWGCGLPDGFSVLLSLQPAVLPRAGTTPTFGIGSYSERTIPGTFTYRGTTPFELARDALLAKLNVMDPTPRTLYGVRNDGTPCTITAVMSFPAGGNAGGNQEINTVPVTFIAADPVWLATTPATVSATWVGLTQQTLVIPATGFGEQDAKLTLQQTVQRTVLSEAAGWSLRRKYTITNNTGAAIGGAVPYAYAIDLGDTSTLVPTKALASGNDVRIIYQGAELPRTLVSWNTVGVHTLCWINLPPMANGASITLEVWYGNTGAGAPSVLAGKTLPAFDLATSTNAIWKHLASRIAGNAGLGGWGLSSGVQTPTDDHSVPGAWQIATTLDAPDDKWQATYSTYVATGTKYQARFDAKRLYQKSQDFDPQQYTAGDGVSLYCPSGITQVRCDIDYEIQKLSPNSSKDIGQVVLLARPNATANWQGVFAITTGGPAQLAVANYAISPAAPYVAFAVWPAAGQGSIDKSASAGRYVYGGWYSVLEVSIDSTKITQTLSQAEETIMDVALTIYDGGGTTHVAPYKVLRLGGAATRRYATRINEKLTIDAPNRRATLYQSNGTTVVEAVPVAAIAASMELAGDTAERAADRWLPIDPQNGSTLYGTTNGGTVVAAATYNPTFA